MQEPSDVGIPAPEFKVKIVLAISRISASIRQRGSCIRLRECKRRVWMITERTQERNDSDTVERVHRGLHMRVRLVNYGCRGLSRAFEHGAAHHERMSLLLLS